MMDEEEIKEINKIWSDIFELEKEKVNKFKKLYEKEINEIIKDRFDEDVEFKWCDEDG